MVKCYMKYRVTARTKVDSEVDARILANVIETFAGDGVTATVGNDRAFKDATLVDVEVVAPNRIVAWWRRRKVKSVVKRSPYRQRTELLYEV